jgi:hypothetical protein
MRYFHRISPLLGIALLLAAGASSAAIEGANTEKLSRESSKCVACHTKESPGIVQQWGASEHFRANVGCYECHAANESDKDAFEHHKETISIIVSPKDCSTCHSREVKEMTESHHAYAGNILGSLDNLLAEVVEGNNEFKTEAFPHGNSAVAVNGCWQCHGSEVKVLEDGKLDPATWPNSGIGRINPDGSKGACTACHIRHAYSDAQVRAPETCGKCHLGPDHPQKEVYEESKHGIAYETNVDKMNLDNPKWVVGVDYDAAPTCATCHVSATKSLPVTHDVGARISWNNRPPLSIRPEVADAKMGLPGKDISWQERRKDMQNVCRSCHNKNFVASFYDQYDAVVELYNAKFGKPGGELYAAAKPLLKPAKFSNALDWTWFKIWHHEGRRMRMGAAMQGPDYTHWNGAFEVAENFYIKMIGELEELVNDNLNSRDPAKAKAARALQARIDEVLNSNNHKWYLNKMDPAEKERRKESAEAFKARYK